jgi:hypothetical protein
MKSRGGGVENTDDDSDDGDDDDEDDNVDRDEFDKDDDIDDNGEGFVMSKSSMSMSSSVLLNGADDDINRSTFGMPSNVHNLGWQW